MSIYDEIKDQKNKLKDMTLEKKCKYIWDYYKIPIIAVILIFTIGFFLIRDVKNNMKPVYLDAVILNSNLIDSDRNDLKTLYIKYADIDIFENNLYIETGISLSDEYYNQNSMTTMQKLVAMMNAETLDVLVGPASAIAMFEDIQAYLPIEDVLSDDLRKEIESKGLEYYYSDLPEYSSRPIGIDITSLAPIQESYTINNDDPIIFAVIVNTKNPEHSAEFLAALMSK